MTSYTPSFQTINMSIKMFNKILTILRYNVRMTSVSTTRKLEGKVAVVTASTDG